MGRDRYFWICGLSSQKCLHEDRFIQELVKCTTWRPEQNGCHLQTTYSSKLSMKKLIIVLFQFCWNLFLGSKWQVFFMGWSNGFAANRGGAPQLTNIRCQNSVSKNGRWGRWGSLFCVTFKGIYNMSLLFPPSRRFNSYTNDGITPRYSSVMTATSD